MATLLINEKKKLGTIAPEIYGHFSEHLGRCIYDGIFVGNDSDIPNVNGMRTDVVDALRELQVPLLRWPGGCFADEYHWRDGIGPVEKRKKMVNTNWGGVTENNSFGTHEFMELCRQLGCKTYVNGNLGSGTVQEMSEWVEYMTFGGFSPLSEERKANGHAGPWTVDYFGVGNENWGCGGNMTPSHYANEYRRYQTFVRCYDPERPIRKIACGPNTDDYEWTEEVLKTAFAHTLEGSHGFMDLLSLHYYTVPGDVWEHKGSATEFDEAEWYKTLGKCLYMDTLIKKHGEIMDRFDPKKEIGLSVDEWGNWFDVEPGTNPGFLYQQNTMRDALVAGITLNIFNKHCDRVRLACLAQMVNVLQSVILTDGDRMLKTPTYHVMHMFRHHQGAELVESTLTGAGCAADLTGRDGGIRIPSPTVGASVDFVPAFTESVSEKDGILTITLNHLSADRSEEVRILFEDPAPRKVLEAQILAGGDIHAHNTFEDPGRVAEAAFNGLREEGDGFAAVLPPASVVLIRLKKE